MSLKSYFSFLNRWVKHLLLAWLSAVFCVLASPVLSEPLTAHLTAQTLPDRPNPEEQARNLFELGQFQEAAQILQQAVRANQEQGNTLQQAIDLGNLAQTYQQMGLWNEANRAIDTSLDLLETVQPQNRDRLSVLAQALDTRGDLELAQGQAQQAFDSWDQAIDLYQQLNDSAGTIRSRINQAQALQALGLYPRAVTALRDLNQTLQAQPDSLTKVVGLRSLGDALRVAGDLDESQGRLRQSLEIAQQLQLPEAIAAAQLSLGNTARSQQDIEAALSYYQQAAGSNVVTIQTQAQLNRLNLLLDRQQEAQAERLVPQIRAQLDRLPPGRSAIDARINFAQSLIRLRMSGLADPTWTEITQILTTAQQQAEALGDRRVMSYALGTLGTVHEQMQEVTIAQDLTIQALQNAQAIRDADITYRWQWQLGRLRKAQDDRDGAIAAYDAAYNTLQSLRRDVVTSNVSYQRSFRQTAEEPVYRGLIDLLLSNPTQAELKRARQVITSLQVAQIENFLQQPCTDATPEQIDAVIKQQAQSSAVLYPIILPDRLEVILKLPQEENLRHYRSNVDAVTLKQTIAQLQLDLEEEYTFAAVKTGTHRLYDWLLGATEVSTGATQQIATTLREKEITTLVFVLDESLRNIPMAALYNGTHYLMEDYAIAIAPGLDLIAPKPLPPDRLKVLAVGLTEPLPNQGNFAKLTNVGAELDAIAATGAAVTTIRDQSFTREAFNQEINKAAFPIVHIATHGQFSSDPQDTFLLTSNARITVNELDTLFRVRGQIRPDVIELLVLSACETAAGDELASLGIAGTAVRAGARSTIASLWTLDDAFSAEFARQLYQSLGKPGVSKAEALRRAQQFLLIDPQYEHPRYWATYVLIGNWL